jgi:ribosome biogenesis GTPase A
MDIQWYPGHMQKAKRKLSEQLKLIDVVIEVLDARLPEGTKNPDFDELFSGKKRFYVLNKADLADPAVTKKWVAHYTGQGIPCAAFSAVSSDPGPLTDAILSVASEMVERWREKGVHKIVRAMVAGIPNVGKSAVLNRLSQSKKMKEGNKPGVTRGLQWARISPYFEVMDTPGILMPKIEDEETAAKIAAIGSIKQELLEIENLAFYLIQILTKNSSNLLKKRYNLGSLDADAAEVLKEICKQRGFLMKGGEFDIERGARIVLDEFKNGKIGRISLEVPE